MGYREIFDEIKKGRLGRLYLFHGEEEYIKEQALNQMVEVLVPPDFRDLNYQTLDGTQAGVEQIIHACETLPFMAERRLVVIKDSILLEEKKDSGAEKQLEAYLETLPETTCLVFYNRGNTDKRKALYSFIKKRGKAVEFERLTPQDLQRWVGSTLKKQNKTMSPEDIQYFLYLTGNKLEDVSNELAKLVAYVGDRASIRREDLDRIVTRNPEHTVFQLVEAIGEKKSGQALALLDELLYNGQPLLAILSMIARQFRLILQCKILGERGYTKKDIAMRLETQSFVVEKCIRQGRNFSVEQLEKALEECLNVDYGIKSGRMKDRLGVELLIIKMCK